MADLDALAELLRARQQVQPEDDALVKLARVIRVGRHTRTDKTGERVSVHAYTQVRKNLSAFGGVNDRTRRGEVTGGRDAADRGATNTSAPVITRSTQQTGLSREQAESKLRDLGWEYSTETGLLEAPVPTLTKSQTPSDQHLLDLATGYRRRAEEVEPPITDTLQTLVGDGGGYLHKLEYRFKTVDSMAGKIIRTAKKYNLDIDKYEPNDALRYTAVVPPEELSETAEKILARLASQGHQVYRTNNAWGVGGDYHGVNVNLRAPDGTPWELQFHTEEEMGRDATLHYWYEIQRHPLVSQDLVDFAETRAIESMAGIAVPRNAGAVASTFPGFEAKPDKAPRYMDGYVGGTQSGIPAAAQPFRRLPQAPVLTRSVSQTRPAFVPKPVPLDYRQAGTIGDKPLLGKTDPTTKGKVAAFYEGRSYTVEQDSSSVTITDDETGQSVTRKGSTSKAKDTAYRKAIATFHAKATGQKPPVAPKKIDGSTVKAADVRDVLHNAGYEAYRIYQQKEDDRSRKMGFSGESDWITKWGLYSAGLDRVLDRDPDLTLEEAAYLGLGLANFDQPLKRALADRGYTIGKRDDVLEAKGRKDLAAAVLRQADKGDPPGVSTAPDAPDVAEGQRTIRAYRDGQEVGSLTWALEDGASYTKGTIDLVKVKPTERRKGIATFLLKRAREIDPDVHHSDIQTGDGGAWAQVTRSVQEVPDTSNPDGIDAPADQGNAPRRVLRPRPTPPRVPDDPTDLRKISAVELGMEYDPANAERADVKWARSEEVNWAEVPVVAYPMGNVLHATEEAMMARWIEWGQNGWDERPGYEAHILRTDDGDFVTDGHHRVGVALALAQKTMPTRVLDVRTKRALDPFRNSTRFGLSQQGEPMKDDGGAIEKMSRHLHADALGEDDLDLVLALSRQMTRHDLVELAGRLDFSPKKNWVEKAGGLPKYIEDIALALIRDHGMNRSRAIATAINRVKKWAAGVGETNADTKVKAAAALAQWEALKAKNKAK